MTHEEWRNWYQQEWRMRSEYEKWRKSYQEKNNTTVPVRYNRDENVPTVGDIRQMIANLPDDASLVIWDPTTKQHFTVSDAYQGMPSGFSGFELIWHLGQMFDY